MTPLTVGSLCWTPFEPRGLVQVLELEGAHPVVPRCTARVRFLHDHAGYEAWSEGRYFVDELIPLLPPEGGQSPSVEVLWMKN